MSDAKDAAAVRVLPPAVPLAAVLLGVALARLAPIDPGFELPGRGWIGGLIVAGAFFGFGVWPVLLFRRSGQSPNPWKPTPRIVERGPYRITRNPMYVQMVLICVGLAVLWWNAWILILTPAVAWILQRFVIVPEEAYLEGKFGDEYRAYQGRVGRWL